MKMKKQTGGNTVVTGIGGLVATGLVVCVCLAAQQQPGTAPAPNPSLVQSGQAIFRRDCAFCHGRDAGGGESGPDLTRSRLVTEDVAGSTIAPVIRNGRPDRGMPSFPLSEQDIESLVAFIHNQKATVGTRKGGRRGVDAADLQTGDAEAGKEYFAKACASCHSPTGDLAGIASRVKGLRLEQRMLYPRDAKSTLTVTLPSGQTIAGTLQYMDEFTVALRDGDGQYRSWSTGDVKYTVSSPADAHVDLLGKYSDADVHNLMAYLQTLK
jgi:cytochrome c oxidase cbb3-type subunit 3